MIDPFTRNSLSTVVTYHTSTFPCVKRFGFSFQDRIEVLEELSRTVKRVNVLGRGCTHNLACLSHMTIDLASLQSRDGARRVSPDRGGGSLFASFFCFFPRISIEMWMLLVVFFSLFSNGFLLRDHGLDL